MKPIGRFVVRGEQGQNAGDPLISDGLIIGSRIKGSDGLLKPGTVYEIVEVNNGLRIRPIGLSCIKNYPRPQEGIDLCWQNSLDELLAAAGTKILLTEAELLPAEPEKLPGDPNPGDLS